MAKATKATPKATENGSGEGGIMEKRKSVSKSQKAGLDFPIARVNRYIKKNSGIKRVGASAPVFATATIEYIVSELLDVVGNVTNQSGRKTLSPEDIAAGVRADKELSKLFSGHSIFVGDKISNKTVNTTITYNAKSKSSESATR